MHYLTSQHLCYVFEILRQLNLGMTGFQVVAEEKRVGNRASGHLQRHLSLVLLVLHIEDATSRVRPLQSHGLQCQCLEFRNEECSLLHTTFIIE